MNHTNRGKGKHFPCVSSFQFRFIDIGKGLSNTVTWPEKPFAESIGFWTIYKHCVLLLLHIKIFQIEIFCCRYHDHMEIWHKWLFPQCWMVSGVYEHTRLLMSICLYEKETSNLQWFRSTRRFNVRWENPCWECILMVPWPTGCRVKLRRPDMRVNEGPKLCNKSVEILVTLNVETYFGDRSKLSVVNYSHLIPDPSTFNMISHECLSFLSINVSL